MKVKDTSEVSLLLTDDQGIRELNKTYRMIDSATDVLSFSLLEGKDDFPLSSGRDEEEFLLGDIVISVETAQRQAKLYHHSFQDEMITLLVHGFLHLLGFDHIHKEDAEKMEFEEKKIIQEIREKITESELLDKS